MKYLKKQTPAGAIQFFTQVETSVTADIQARQVVQSEKPESLSSSLHHTKGDAVEIKKNDTLVSKKGVEAKVIQVKEDEYYSGDMAQYRLEMLGGLNQGAKVWYDRKALIELFAKK